jgi:hypothetical protein
MAKLTADFIAWMVGSTSTGTIAPLILPSKARQRDVGLPLHVPPKL